MKPSSLNWFIKRHKNLHAGRQKDMFKVFQIIIRMRVTHKELILTGIRKLHRLKRCRFAEQKIIYFVRQQISGNLANNIMQLNNIHSYNKALYT